MFCFFDRRLCILKGVYPVEPKNKKVNKTSQAKTYYYRKDILYLSHEPIIWKFWDFKVNFQGKRSSHFNSCLFGCRFS